MVVLGNKTQKPNLIETTYSSPRSLFYYLLRNKFIFQLFRTDLGAVKGDMKFEQVKINFCLRVEEDC